MYMKCVIGVIPLITCFIVWILIIKGDAQDYKMNEEGEIEDDFVGILASNSNS